jgi:hypothetical protein
MRSSGHDAKLFTRDFAGHAIYSLVISPAPTVLPAARTTACWTFTAVAGADHIKQRESDIGATSALVSSATTAANRAGALSAGTRSRFSIGRVVDTRTRGSGPTTSSWIWSYLCLNERQNLPAFIYAVFESPFA